MVNLPCEARRVGAIETIHSCESGRRAAVKTVLACHSNQPAAATHTCLASGFARRQQVCEGGGDGAFKASAPA